MCVICVSKAGQSQPDFPTLRAMFDRNPHGAGYMTAVNGEVVIRKGFMTWANFAAAIRSEGFTAADPVVYHFRISTQAGVNPRMCHPFPLTSNIEETTLTAVNCKIGVAHNGVIQLTSDPHDKIYSDTAHYIVEFLQYLVRNPEDIRRQGVLDAIHRTTESRWALMDGSGYIATAGDWVTGPDGLLYSNGNHFPKIYEDDCNYDLFDDFYEDDCKFSLGDDIFR